jgi:hypothetical protein
MSSGPCRGYLHVCKSACRHVGMSACRHVGVAAEPLIRQRLSLNRGGNATYPGGFQSGAAAGGKGASTFREILPSICGPTECCFSSFGSSPGRASGDVGEHGVAGFSMGRVQLYRARTIAASNGEIVDHSIGPRAVWVAGAVKLETAPGLWGRGSRSPPRLATPTPLPSDYRSLTSSRPPEPRTASRSGYRCCRLGQYRGQKRLVSGPLPFKIPAVFRIPRTSRCLFLEFPLLRSYGLFDRFRSSHDR